MLISELIDFVMLESGQFILEELDNTLLDSTKFNSLINRVLPIYSKYHPLTKTDNFTIDKSLIFTVTSTTYGIPNWISDVVPVGDSTQSVAYDQIIQYSRYQEMRRYNGLPYQYHLQPNPMSMSWEYRKPELYVSNSGTYDITMNFDHSLSSEELDGDTIYSLPTLSNADTHFLDLMVGYFMLSLGRSRNAFTLGEIPIQINASEMVSEGRDIIRETMEELKEVGEWWRAIT